MTGVRGSQIGTGSFQVLQWNILSRLPKKNKELGFDPVSPSPCCDPLQIVWWYKPIGSDDYGIHVDWSAWESEYNKLKLISNETFSYYHEYFHHVSDTWKVKHGLSDEELTKNYNRIWISEDLMKDGYKDGILLGETLAEHFAKKRQKSTIYLLEKTHPSYSVRIGSWEWCSLFHVIQILNKKYEIFTHPMVSVVADRNLISDLNQNYEQYEDQLFSVRNGFCLDDSVYEYAKHSPQNIPFYIHGYGKNEDWKNEVLEFCEHNNLANPKFVD
jgi:hypothetical protein